MDAYTRLVVLFQLAAEADSRGATVVAASVPVHRQMASNTLLVAGEFETIETWSSLLHCVSACFQDDTDEEQIANERQVKTIYCGDEAGAAGMAQLCASHHMAIQMLGWMETRNLADRLGLAHGAVDTLLDQMPRPTLVKGAQLDCDSVGATRSINVSVEMMESQLHDTVESARKIQAPVPMGALAAQVYGIVSTGGYLDLDYSAVDTAIYAANEQAVHESDPGQVSLSVDTIQQSLDVRRTWHAKFSGNSAYAIPLVCNTAIIASLACLVWPVVQAIEEEIDETQSGQ